MTEGKETEKQDFIKKVEAYTEQGSYQKVEELARYWLDKFPGDAEAMMYLCHAWTRMGKLDEVTQLLKEVDEAIYGMSLIYARMGDICCRSGLNQEAATFYKKFVDLNPDSPLSIEVTAKLSSILPNRAEDIVPPNGEEEKTKDTPPGLQTVTMAELYLKQGHRDLAVEILNGILEKDRENSRAALLLNKIQSETEHAETSKAPKTKPGAVINKLNGWLKRVDRMRGHAA